MEKGKASFAHSFALTPATFSLPLQTALFLLPCVCVYTGLTTDCLCKNCKIRNDRTILFRSIKICQGFVCPFKIVSINNFFFTSMRRKIFKFVVRKMSEQFWDFFQELRRPIKIYILPVLTEILLN